MGQTGTAASLAQGGFSLRWKVVKAEMPNESDEKRLSTQRKAQRASRGGRKTRTAGGWGGVLGNLSSGDGSATKPVTSWKLLSAHGQASRNSCTDAAQVPPCRDAAQAPPLLREREMK